VAGLSMGGLLALYLAQKYPDIKGIILINHAIFFVDKKIHLVPFLKNIIKQSKGVGNDIKDKKQDEKPYPIIPTAGVMELLKLVKLVKSIHHKIKQPTLIFKSVEDHVVSFKSAEYTYDNIYSLDKEIIWLKNSYHVATMDYDKDLIVQRIIEFITRLSNDNKGYPAAKQQKISSNPSKKKSVKNTQPKNSKAVKKIKSASKSKNKTKTIKNLKKPSKKKK
jgi:carboxylesterase